jgi:single-strand DNA-binding protein
MNMIQIAGHLGADPETRFTQTGKKVTTMRVATRTRRAGKDDTIWWRVTVWGDQFEKMMPHLKKGSAVMVWGEVHKPEIFNDREGKPQIGLEITAIQIQFSPFGKPGGSQSAQEGGQPAGHQPAAAPFGMLQEGAAPNPYMQGKPGVGQPQGQGATFDDEVPF